MDRIHCELPFTIPSSFFCCQEKANGEDVTSVIVNGNELSNLLALHERGMVEQEKARQWCALLSEQLPKMKPAINWLCVNGVDEAILIDEIRSLIDRKWTSMGYPFFMRSFYFNLLLAVLITFTSCLVEVHLPFSTTTTTTGYDRSKSIIVSVVLTIVHLLVLVIFAMKAMHQCWDVFCFKVHRLLLSREFPFIHFHTEFRGM
jgi:hypothetical protein